MRTKMLDCIVFLVYYKRAAGVQGPLCVFRFGHCSGCFGRDVIGLPRRVKPARAIRIPQANTSVCTVDC